MISVDYKAQLSTPKTAAGRRAVELDPDTIEELRQHQFRITAERDALGLPWAGAGDLVFADLGGIMIHRGQFADRFDVLVKRASVPRVRFHDLRHTHASLMLAAGVHPKVVQERPGHANITVTLQTYSHVIPAMQTAAASQFAALIEAS